MLYPNSPVPRWFLLLCLLGITISLDACLNRTGQLSQRTSTAVPHVLVFSKTKVWKHPSIPFGIAAIQTLGKENGFLVDETTDAGYFTEDSLRKYQAVIFISTTGNVLNGEQQAAFERYIQAGGGFVGIHAAADTEYEWPWYNKLIGAYFASHPHNPNVRRGTIDVTDKRHPATAGLPDRWERTDEWYNYKSIYPGITVLASLDENTYEGGTNGGNHPIAWYHAFDGGRAFYTGGGHTDESFSEPLFLKHLLGGIRYAIGDGKPLDYRMAYAKVVPEENRFVKTTLIGNLNEPMEVAVADDGRVFFTERTGNLSMYHTRTGKHALVHKFSVTEKGGFGLQGVTLDPDFLQNNFMYVYYAPYAEKEPYYHYLSRFTVKADNTLNVASEKIYIKVPVDVDGSSHHGGSLAWDKEGNLYLSTGDSSSPTGTDGYSPIDERPGRYNFDAQRSSANTNDYRGKILRIHPEPDGTYTIPEGNLFSKGMAKTLPEIYTMGNRNPYRIGINPKTSVVYWGDIGPDAGHDSIQGPKGYDEFNQAKKPGNYGWPYFSGNNQAYVKWDFATRTAGPRFDPDASVNNSPNNTGLNRLPPALPAFIWYPYEASKEFPELGMGGRCSMVGEFYTFDKNAASLNKFPEYYDGALFVFDWVRNWVLAFRFDANDNYLRSEPFMTSNGNFQRPMDLAFGKDGVMYLLEYGSRSGPNEDAKLVKIEYNTGNRAPLARASVTDSAAVAQVNARSFVTSELENVPVLREAAGPVPLRVRFSSHGTHDLDEDDKLKYEWLFDGKTVGSTRPNPIHTYAQPGIYLAILRVTDGAGAVGTDTIVVKAGNAPPVVTINTPSNKSFYWENQSLPYSVQVTDKEDGKVDPKKIKVYFDYNPQPGAPILQPTQNQPTTALGETKRLGDHLIAQSDCKACHTVDKPSFGPSFTAIAHRYKGQAGTVNQVAQKIIKGGGGSWGAYTMSAHPQLSPQDAAEMVKYIFSLAEPKKQKAVLPAQGTVSLQEHQANEPRGQYTLRAIYTDSGGQVVGPLTSSAVLTLRPATVRALAADAYAGFQRSGSRLGKGKHKSYVLLKDVDLTGVKKFTFEYASLNRDGEFEVRLNSQAGPVISRTPYTATGAWNTVKQVTGELSTPTTGKHNVYFVVVNREKPNDEIMALSSVRFDP